jgi:hypothetical protein
VPEARSLKPVAAARQLPGLGYWADDVEAPLMVSFSTFQVEQSPL